MSHPAALAASWTVEPAVAVPLAATAALYLRGWTQLSRRLPGRFGPGRAAAFAGGSAALAVASCAALESLSREYLQAHMVQHLLLTVVAPPLLWLGAPVAPLLLGLPRPVRRITAAVLATRPARRLSRVLADPRLAWLGFSLAFWIWHLPGPYDLALRSDLWHHVEHASFLLTALLFWRPVIAAWPARRAWPPWAMVVYLLLADAQNTLLAAILTFADRAIYPFYARVERVGGIGGPEDQALAGMIMWVPGSLAFLLPALWLLITALGSSAGAEAQLDGRARPRIPARDSAGEDGHAVRRAASAGS